MKDLDTIYYYYESEMSYPAGQKLLWEGIVKAYVIMCGLSAKLKKHRSRTKYVDIQKAILADRKQRRYTKEAGPLPA